ncbi:patatin-like phospholipase family protein [Vibrio aestuarianus]|uniref:patatin-like phospholipase family protein n=1 Tax=Vibrio aestuarianus TaxID=28171 RepID=UPI00237C9F29|nr:patatin-like phospholipase family protein [Vibrio aestuarianus]MDE1263881.1 DUF6363 domain-containing protein [Vibrio aestuarianus]MDE1295809.1 DUF6363 domain-containing protein [Vibrio aestuarianus]
MNNSGTVSDKENNVDVDRFSKYIGGKNALVAQGGGQRGIFTAGVLDAFLLSNFDPFHEFYGTSAGALNLCAYLCRQRGLGKAFILDLTTDPNFFNLFGYVRRKQYLNLDWALDRISEFPYRLDIDMGRRVLEQRQAYAATTSASTLHDHYFPMLGERWRDVLTATCAIPRLYPHEVKLDDGAYIDGGVSASIPVQEAWRKGSRFVAVIRTECADYDPKANTTQPKLSFTGEAHWLSEPLNNIQGQWQQKLSQWKQGWNGFVQQKIERAKEQKKEQIHLQLLNGGRWLFGADDIYRLSHLIGDKFDSGLADMLMVHYQTYSLTQDFLHKPPDDVFVLQIVPSEPLKSNSLLSNKDDLFYDYALGVKAGYEFIKQFDKAQSAYKERIKQR